MEGLTHMAGSALYSTFFLSAFSTFSSTALAEEISFGGWLATSWGRSLDPPKLPSIGTSGCRSPPTLFWRLFLARIGLAAAPRPDSAASSSSSLVEVEGVAEGMPRSFDRSTGRGRERESLSYTDDDEEEEDAEGADDVVEEEEEGEAAAAVFELEEAAEEEGESREVDEAIEAVDEV